MADRSNIEWCDSTFNPWIGCTKVSPACDNCYAEADFDKRRHIVTWGAGQARHRTTAANWRKPLRWNAKPFYECPECGWRGDKPSTQGGSFTDGLPSCPHCDSMGLIDARRRVFCASLADVFDNEVPDEWRVDLFSLIDATPHLDWLLLTKRIGNVGNMLPVPFDFECLYPNVWLGATICNQAEADRDIPKLLAVPAAVRFLSMEPLLGPVNVYSSMTGELLHTSGDDYNPGSIDWVIVGGESGPNARPMHPDWARSLRNQCASANVPMLLKQWGEFAPNNRTFDEIDASPRKLTLVPFSDEQPFPMEFMDLSLIHI